jgi:hypothetical protein
MKGPKPQAVRGCTRAMTKSSTSYGSYNSGTWPGERPGHPRPPGGVPVNPQWAPGRLASVLRSRVSNGKDLFSNVDGRSASEICSTDQGGQFLRDPLAPEAITCATFRAAITAWAQVACCHIKFGAIAGSTIGAANGIWRRERPFALAACV